MDELARGFGVELLTFEHVGSETQMLAFCEGMLSEFGLAATTLRWKVFRRDLGWSTSYKGSVSKKLSQRIATGWKFHDVLINTNSVDHLPSEPGLQFVEARLRLSPLQAAWDVIDKFSICNRMFTSRAQVNTHLYLTQQLARQNSLYGSKGDWPTSLRIVFKCSPVDLSETRAHLLAQIIHAALKQIQGRKVPRDLHLYITNLQVGFESILHGVPLAAGSQLKEKFVLPAQVIGCHGDACLAIWRANGEKSLLHQAITAENREFYLLVQDSARPDPTVIQQYYLKGND